MRLLHCSDTHVGFAAYSRVTPEGLNQREADFFDAFTRVIDLALAERVDAVLHSGDLFDSVRPTNRALGHVMAQVSRLAAARIPFVVISGNHEAPRLRETGAVLRLLEFLPGVRAVYKGRTEVARVGDLAIHATPHAASTEMLLEQLAAVSPDADARYNVATLHAGVLGVGDFEGGEFHEQVVPQNALPAGMDYVALGHYHRGMEVRPGAWYAGSPERLTFRECGEEKGVNLVDLETGRVEVRVLPTRPMLQLPLLACEGMADIDVAPELMRRIAAAPLEGAIARLRATGVPPHVYATLDHRRLRDATAKALHFELQAEVARAEAPGQDAGRIGDLAEEFDAFLAARPVGPERDALRAAAHALLQEARG